MTVAHRAYSLLEIKAIDEEQRVIEGMATTPTPDRIGDIVDPMGAKFSLPIPLLWQHRSAEPVGQVEFAKASKDGIPFRARIAKIEEPGRLKDRIDEAWQSVKAGLVRAVSIGFRTIEHSVMDDGGWRFIDWEWLELSLVTIPANQEATIDVVRSIDTDVLAASGHEDVPVASRPGAAGKSVKLSKRKEREMKTFSEQISDLEATRAAKSARMAEIMQKSVEEGRSTDEAEQEEFDTLEREVEAVDGDLKRFRTLEKANVATVKPVTAPNTPEHAAEIRGGNVRITSPKAAPGIRFARVVKCLGMAKGNLGDAHEIAKQLYSDDQGILNIMQASVRAGMITRAAVPGATTTDATWAGALVGDETSVFADFVEFLRPMTIVGRFGTGGIPSLRMVPFRVALIGQTSGGTGYWVGEGAGKPLTKADFERRTLEPLKVANIAVATMETLRDSSPSAEMLIRDTLAGALGERINADFIDPAITAQAGIRPASITNGVTPIVSTGNTADDVREDVRLLMSAFAAANNPPTSGVWVMSSTTALALSLLVNALGQPEFSGIGMGGGVFFGLPVVTSEHVPTTALSPSGTSSIVVLANAGDIYFGDDGGIAVDMSREASLQMDDAPTQHVGTGSPPAPVATSLVSMFQTNSVAFRAERTLNWMRRRDSGVQVLSAVSWGQP